MGKQTITAIARRLDAIAIDQLRAEVVRLAEENEGLRQRLADAEQDADWWRADAIEQNLRLCEAVGGSPGITIDGRLVVAPGGAA